MAGIKKTSLVDQVYSELRNEIITLERPLGSRLNVNELQDELGVSCTPIREAVNRLQQEGLVVYENNVGATILSLDAHDVIEIQQLSMALHKAAIRLAMENGDRDTIIAGLTEQLENYKNAKTVQEEVLAVNKFMGTFYRNSGNERLDKSMLAVQGQQLILRNLYAGLCEKRASDVDCYEGILQAVKDGDGKKVQELLMENVKKMDEVLCADGAIAS